MLNLPVRCQGPRGVSRRKMIEIGASAALGLSLPAILRAEGQAPAAGLRLTATADACILVFLDGGPSHLDMWDMKPDAAAEIRGEFRPIATRLPGISVSEHLPRLSTVLHLGTLIRSAHHSVNNSHGAAVYTSLTGLDRGEVGGIFQPTDHPAIGAVVGLCRPPKAAVPAFVSMPYITAEGAGNPPQPGFFGGWLGRSHDPMFVLTDPNAADFAMPELSLPKGVGAGRLADRQRLGAELGVASRGMERDRRDRGPRPVPVQGVRHPDLLRRPASLSDRPGRPSHEGPLREEHLRPERAAGPKADRGGHATRLHLVGSRRQRHLGHARQQLHHAQEYAPAAARRRLSPPCSRISSARGMLQRTLVVVMGEFGRSPKVNAAARPRPLELRLQPLPRRGGIKAGHVHGASDKIGATPLSDPVTPAEIVATIYRCLGIPADLELHDQFQRPLTVVPQPGRPIAGLLA